MDRTPYFVVGLLCVVLLPECLGNHDAKRLYDDLMRKSGYNPLIRPVGNSTAKLTVKLGLKLSQLIDVVRRQLIYQTEFVCQFFSSLHQDGIGK